MNVHDPHCQCGAYACELRAKSLQVSTAALPSRHNRKAPAEHTGNGWEKGIAGETRRDGSFMPYLDTNMSEIGVKQAAERRHEIDRIRSAQLRPNPAPT